MAEDGQAEQTVFTIEKVFLKDVSFESPHSPGVFTQNVQPQGGVQLDVKHSQLDAEQGFYEVILSLSVTAKEGDKTWFLVELQQAGVFRIGGVKDEDIPRFLEIACPNILLPFAREAVADLIGKGGFPPLMLQPVNFESLYMQKLQSQTADSGAVATTH